MNTFAGAAPGHGLNLGQNLPRIISRRPLRHGVLALALALLTLLLGACSATRLAYNQAPNLVYWWIDGYTDLNDAQSVQLRQDIDSFFAWHRSTELPIYTGFLMQWQQLAVKDSTAQLTCIQFERLRSSYLRLIDRSLEPLARLALQLTPDQLQHMERHYAKSNQVFEEDYLGSPEQRLDTLLDKATSRYETLYGTLTDAQTALLTQRLRQSAFDPQRIHAERLRRQSDLLQTLRGLLGHAVGDNGSSPSATAPTTPPATQAAAVAALRAWHDRVMRAPVPGFHAYSESLVREGCEQFAALHNSTSPAQRAHAVDVLKGYEEDLRALMATH